MDFSDEENQDLDLSDSSTVDKYKAAGEVANHVMVALITECKAGKLVVELCVLGDKLIEETVAKVYNKNKIEKGIAFPTCISINNCVGHNSPLASEDNGKVTLKDGDVVKIDLGVHIDGYISQAAHTIIVGQQQGGEATKGRAADVICAAHFAAECAHRLVRPGKTNKDVTAAIQLVAKAFNCNAVEGVLSHQVKRFVIDGNKCIINKPDVDQQVEECTFEVNEVYCVDIVMSTGEGKTKDTGLRTTVYKRAVDQTYSLKSKHSRFVLTEVSKRFSSMPFNLRALGDETKAKFGIVELVNHDLVHPYPVLFEKEGELVAQFKFTLLVLPNSTTRLNTFPLPFVSSSFSIDGDKEIGKIMQMSTKRSKPKKKKPAKKTAAATTPGAPATTPAPAADADKMDTTK